MKEFYKQAVIIYGSPGSGKGTQAELLARKFNFIHFDSGRYIESIVNQPGWQRDAVLRRERRLFDTGKLCTPSWVLRISKQAAQKIADAGFSFAASGSPRTLYEAFGSKNDGLVFTLEKLYGKKNVTAVELLVGEKSSLRRNSHRLVCSVCGLPLLAKTKLKTCAFCAGKMRIRSLDNPAIIKIRLKEYQDRTYPILAKMKQLGFRIIKINGEPPPYQVHDQIVKRLKLSVR